jgi:hypothetical protein
MWGLFLFALNPLTKGFILVFWCRGSGNAMITSKASAEPVGEVPSVDGLAVARPDAVQ